MITLLKEDDGECELDMWAPSTRRDGRLLVLHEVQPHREELAESFAGEETDAVLIMVNSVNYTSITIDNFTE